MRDRRATGEQERIGRGHDRREHGRDLLPGEPLVDPEREQLLHRLLSRYRAHGLLGATGQSEIFLGFGPAQVLSDGTPRPRIQGASARYGRESLAPDGELLPPLLYSTELARSVSLQFAAHARTMAEPKLP